MLKISEKFTSGNKIYSDFCGGESRILLYKNVQIAEIMVWGLTLSCYTEHEWLPDPKTYQFMYTYMYIFKL